MGGPLKPLTAVECCDGAGGLRAALHWPRGARVSNSGRDFSQAVKHNFQHNFQRSLLFNLSRSGISGRISGTQFLRNIFEILSNQTEIIW